MKLHGENQYWIVGQMGTVSVDPSISALSLYFRGGEWKRGILQRKSWNCAAAVHLCSQILSLDFSAPAFPQAAPLPSVHRPPPLRAAASEAGPVLTVMLGSCAGFPRVAQQLCGPETATLLAAEPPNSARGRRAAGGPSRNGHSIRFTVYKTLLPVFHFNAQTGLLLQVSFQASPE